MQIASLLSLSALLFFPATGGAQCLPDKFLSTIPKVAEKNAPSKIWEWESNGYLQSLSLSKDGKVIAVAKEPECEISANRSYYDFGTPGAKFDCSEGQLTVLNGKGKPSWRFPNSTPSYAQNEAVIGVYDVDVSANGQYIVASVSKKPCIGETWRVYGTDDVQINVVDRKTVERLAKKGSVGERLLESWNQSTKDVESMVCQREVVSFRADGEILWKHPARGMAKISPDGNFVMVIPYIGWLLLDRSYAEGCAGSYIYGNSWYLFSIDGKKLLEKKVETDDDAHAVELLYQDKYTKGPFSQKGDYFIFANSLYRIEGGLPLKLHIEGLPQSAYLTNISPAGSYALAISSPSTLGRKFYTTEEDDLPLPREPRRHLYYLIDVSNRKVLWAKPIPQLFRGTRTMGERAKNDEPYLYNWLECPISLTDKYIIGCNGMDVAHIPQNSPFNMITVDIKSGKVSEVFKSRSNPPAACGTEVNISGNYLDFTDESDTALISMRGPGRTGTVLVSYSLSVPEKRCYWSYSTEETGSVESMYYSPENVVVSLYTANSNLKKSNWVLRTFDRSRFCK